MMFIFDEYFVHIVCLISRHHVEDGVLHVCVAAMCLLSLDLVLAIHYAPVYHFLEERHNTSVTVEVTLCP